MLFQNVSVKKILKEIHEINTFFFLDLVLLGVSELSFKNVKLFVGNFLRRVFSTHFCVLFRSMSEVAGHRVRLFYYCTKMRRCSKMFQSVPCSICP